MQGDGPESGRERGVWMLGVIPCNAMRCRCGCSQCKESVMKWLAWALGVLFVKRRRSKREMRAGRSRDEVLCLTNNARHEREWGLVGLDVRHGRRSETSGFQLNVCCKTRVRGETSDCSDWMSGRQTGQERRERAEMWAMCKMIRLRRRCGLRAHPGRIMQAHAGSLPRSPAPPASNCQLPAASAKQAGKLQKERGRERGRAGRAGQGRTGQGRSGPEVATGWAFWNRQAQGVVQGWHVSPLRPRDLDADPPGGSPQFVLLNERATVGDLMDPEMVVVIKNKYARPR